MRRPSDDRRARVVWASHTHGLSPPFPAGLSRSLIAAWVSFPGQDNHHHIGPVGWSRSVGRLSETCHSFVVAARALLSQNTQDSMPRRRIEWAYLSRMQIHTWLGSRCCCCSQTNTRPRRGKMCRKPKGETRKGASSRRGQRARAYVDSCTQWFQTAIQTHTGLCAHGGERGGRFSVANPPRAHGLVHIVCG